MCAIQAMEYVSITPIHAAGELGGKSINSWIATSAHITYYQTLRPHLLVPGPPYSRH